MMQSHSSMPKIDLPLAHTVICFKRCMAETLVCSVCQSNLNVFGYSSHFVLTSCNLPKSGSFTFLACPRLLCASIEVTESWWCFLFIIFLIKCLSTAAVAEWVTQGQKTQNGCSVYKRPTFPGLFMEILVLILDLSRFWTRKKNYNYSIDETRLSELPAAISHWLIINGEG